MHQRALGHGRPRFTPTDLTGLATTLRTPSDRIERAVVGAYDGPRGPLLGACVTILPLLDNLDQAWVYPFVDPAVRRRGVGSALAAHALAQIGARGRRTVLAEIELDGAPSADEAAATPEFAFARRWGFAIGQRSVRRELALPADPSRLAALDAWASRGAAYRIETHPGMPPEADVPAVAELMGLVEVDAPSGEVDFEPGVFTPQGLHTLWTARLDAGMTLLCVLARADDGGVVGFSTQQAPGEAGEPVLQTDTYVRRDHRGHGLGAALKAAGARWWAEHEPDRPCLRTCNAEDNTHMVAINEAAGFVAIETILELVRRGDPAEPGGGSLGANSGQNGPGAAPGE